jgi:hypothetical protein
MLLFKLEADDWKHELTSVFDIKLENSTLRLGRSGLPNFIDKVDAREC